QLRAVPRYELAHRSEELERELLARDRRLIADPGVAAFVAARTAPARDGIVGEQEEARVRLQEALDGIGQRPRRLVDRAQATAVEREAGAAAALGIQVVEEVVLAQHDDDAVHPALRQDLAQQEQLLRRPDPAQPAVQHLDHGIRPALQHVGEYLS